eukprot:Hpha_TRINITY_DN4265_c0_g1::TRINITY_DN4265_c0_g1_i1::g.186646::m.186646
MRGLLRIGCPVGLLLFMPHGVHGACGAGVSCTSVTLTGLSPTSLNQRYDCLDSSQQSTPSQPPGEANGKAVLQSADSVIYWCPNMNVWRIVALSEVLANPSAMTSFCLASAYSRCLADGFDPTCGPADSKWLFDKASGQWGIAASASAACTAPNPPPPPRPSPPPPLSQPP